MLSNGRSLLAVQYNPFHITLTHNFCDDIIKTGDLLNTTNAKIKDGNNANRSSKVSWLEGEHFPNHLHQCIDSANKLYNFSLHEFEPIQYTIYEEGDHYDWHVDNDVNMQHEPPVRKISMTLLLSPESEFEGGDLELMSEGKIAKLKQGHAVFFASFIRHRVTPVIRGRRQSLVMWFGGTPFR